MYNRVSNKQLTIPVQSAIIMHIFDRGAYLLSVTAALFRPAGRRGERSICRSGSLCVRLSAGFAE